MFESSGGCEEPADGLAGEARDRAVHRVRELLLLELTLLVRVEVRLGHGGHGRRGGVELREDGRELYLASCTIGVGRRGRCRGHARRMAAVVASHALVASCMVAQAVHGR